MHNLELILSFERTKNNILDKIQKAKEKWQRVWQEAQGNPVAEADLVHLKLEIQIMEVQALKELKKLDEKIKGSMEDGGGVEKIEKNSIVGFDMSKQKEAVSMKTEDIGNPKWDCYYDAMESLNGGDTGTAKRFLKKAIKTDEDFVAAYMGMTAVFKEEEDKKNIRKYTNLAYQKTRKIFPQWPERMIWGVLQNRQYLRAICDKAALFHNDGDVEEAERIYRLILKLNPGDNQGVRYLIAGMFAGLMPQDIDDMFDEGNESQNWDKLEKLLYKQNELHRFFEPPEVF